MKLVSYNLCGLNIPMVDINGVLYTTSTVVCEIFGTNPSTIRTVKQRYPEDFMGISVDTALSVSNCDSKRNGLSVSNCHSKPELCAHLGLDRVRKDTALWSEEDVISFTYHLKCPTATATRREFTALIKQHATKNMIPTDEVQRMIDVSVARAQEGMVSLVEMQSLIDKAVEIKVERYMKARNMRASAAGKALNACKLDKDLALLTLDKDIVN